MSKQRSRVETVTDAAGNKLDPKKVKLLDKSLELPDSVPEPRVMKIILDRRAIETARKATDEFLISRRINVDSDNVSVADVIAVAILAQDAQISGSDAANKAGGYYKNWQEEARREGLMVGMTMHTELNRDPLPYSDDESEDDEPDWLKDDLILPEPQRDLNNRYERRLKQIYDILDEAGTLFSIEFKRILDDDMATQLRKLGVGLGGTDSDGFQSAAANRKVSTASSP